MIKIKLSNNCNDNPDLTLEEVALPLSGQRVIAVCNGSQQVNCTADEAEALGLALLRMSLETKVRSVADDTFRDPPIRVRLKGITDRRAIVRGPHRRIDDKRRARLGSR